MKYDPHDEDPHDRPARRPPHGPLGPGISIGLLLLGIALGLGVFWLGGIFRGHNKEQPLTDPNVQPRAAADSGPLDGEEQEAVDLFKKVKPSVVNVDLVQVRKTGWDDRPSETKTSGGSGFMWDDDGRIVTNYHVVADLNNRPNMTVRIVLADRSAYDAVVVGAAPDFDLAVLQFAPNNRPSADKIKKIELGTSSKLEVGQKVFAIGNPYGLSLTMTKGIISELDRVIESPANTPIPGIIQVDAAINPGNSGGPLLNRKGQLIGVNTAIASATGGNVGIGFAIPSDTVNQVVTQVIRSGRVLRADLGIKLLDQRTLRRARFDRGVMVQTTTPNGPAAKAGVHGVRRNPRTGQIEPGDLIVAINGEPIDNVEDYELAVRKLKPGDPVTLKIVHDEAEEEISFAAGGT